jgi:hypothetical protein
MEGSAFIFLEFRKQRLAFGKDRRVLSSPFENGILKIKEIRGSKSSRPVGSSLISKRTGFLLRLLTVFSFVLCYPFELCDPIIIEAHEGSFEISGKIP